MSPWCICLQNHKALYCRYPLSSWDYSSIHRVKGKLHIKRMETQMQGKIVFLGRQVHLFAQALS